MFKMRTGYAAPQILPNALDLLTHPHHDLAAIDDRLTPTAAQWCQPLSAAVAETR
jgi:hypothetical protein